MQIWLSFSLFNTAGEDVFCPVGRLAFGPRGPMLALGFDEFH